MYRIETAEIRSKGCYFRKYSGSPQGLIFIMLILALAGDSALVDFRSTSKKDMDDENLTKEL
jgi:hypothetical protein